VCPYSTIITITKALALALGTLAKFGCFGFGVWQYGERM
jgi:hypothetical protein